MTDKPVRVRCVIDLEVEVTDPVALKVAALQWTAGQHDMPTESIVSLLCGNALADVWSDPASGMKFLRQFGPNFIAREGESFPEVHLPAFDA